MNYVLRVASLKHIWTKQQDDQQQSTHFILNVPRDSKAKAPLKAKFDVHVHIMPRVFDVPFIEQS